MIFRIHENESYDHWVERVIAHETRLANAAIARGTPVEEALERYSRRVNSKLLHPIIITVKDESVQAYDAVGSRREYDKIMQAEYPKPADHMSDE